MVKQVYGVYFSATGNTKKLTSAAAEKLAEIFACPCKMIDFTTPSVREQDAEFGPEDLVVVGSPTYAGKLPNKILPDFQTKLKGSDTPAVALVTFGNRSFDNSLAELVTVLSGAGFKPAAGAAFACRHAFSDLLAGDRPNAEDMAACAEFAAKAAESVKQGSGELTVDGDAAAPYYVPKGTDGLPAKFLKAKPLTDMEKCTGCGECVKLCPVASINPENVADVPGVCIKCQACIRGCAAHAKYFDDAAFLSHVAMLEQNFTAPKENSFFFA